MDYWSLVDPIWDEISIYDGADAFLQQFARCPEASRLLFAAHWCQSEVCNGGFNQFFCNSTGVLAPEAVEGFRAIQMPQTAALIEKAMAIFGPKYERNRIHRQDILQSLGDNDGLFVLDNEFFRLIETENGGFEKAANTYAETHS